MLVRFKKMENIRYLAVVMSIIFALIASGCGPKERVCSVTHSPMVKPAGSVDLQDQPISSSEDPSHSVIINLKTRNEMISIMSGADGPCYNITNNIGEVILSKGTKQDFQEKYQNGQNIKR